MFERPNRQSIFLALTLLLLTTSVKSQTVSNLDLKETHTSVNCEASIITTEGQVSGLESDNSCAYKGIPYAKAPTGIYRWEPPYPPEYRNTNFRAKDYSDICMQRRLIDRRDGMSEDCLKLNIWRPVKNQSSLPVMVWFHGGANISGSSSKYEFSGSRLAESQNVIVVSFNYRLGVFGFYGPKNKTLKPDTKSAYFGDTHLDHLTGNFGTLDQIAALKWIKNNIGAFGGDANNITIFGESAGAKGVCNMLVSPLSRGLFHRAIMQSSACNKVFSDAVMEERVLDIQRDAGCFDHPEGMSRCMEKMDSYELLLKTGVTPKEAFNVVMIGSGARRYNSYIDGIVIPEQPLQSIKVGNFQRVPVMGGYNLNEEKLYFKFSETVESNSPEDYFSKVLPRLTLSYSDLYQLYTGVEYDRGNLDEASEYAMVRRAWADYAINCPVIHTVSEISQYQSFNTYQYRFDYDNHWYADDFGATHGMELPFIFNSLDKSYFQALYSFGKRGAAMELVEAIQNYWGNFSRDGNPNGSNVMYWPSTMLQNYNTMILDLPMRRTESETKEKLCRVLSENTINQ